MPSFMSSFRRDPASSHISSSTPSPTRKTSVPLHVLCERCRKLSRECSALDWLQRPHGQPPSSWPALSLSTITRLSQSALSCHFCKMVFAKLQLAAELGIRPTGDVGVYFCPETQKGTDLLVRMVLEKGKTKMAEEGKSFATFRLRTYNSEFGSCVSCAFIG
ncbi:hypothetical protein IG631_23258 [Alternaria alternata]|nr:hypothetical protein IG631_23258 [Alternaria alternata]